MLLEMRSICKDYPQGKDVVHILKNISLEIDDGDYLAIMGPSGSGKTTLMNIIGCLDTPTSGTYVLAGEDVSSASDDRLADIRNQMIGFVFQSFCRSSRRSTMSRCRFSMRTCRAVNGVSAPRKRLRASGWKIVWTFTRTSFPAASVSAWRSPAR